MIERMISNLSGGKEFRMIAKTMYGLEDVLAGELEKLGAKNIEKLCRAVGFDGDMVTLYRANYCCRTALSILKPIASFTANNEHELYDNVYKIKWEKYINPDGTLFIDNSVNSRIFNHSLYASQKTKDAICDRLRKMFNKRPSVRREDADLRLNLHIHDNQVTISLDSSGDSLHKRNYRANNGQAPLNEVTAAGLIQLSGWQRDCNFFDPMCGSGTLLIEAAMFAYNIPAQYYRKKFAFKKWGDYSAPLWKKVKAEADGMICDFDYKIWGSDISGNAISEARENIEYAKLHKDIELFRNAIEEQEPPEGKTLAYIACGPARLWDNDEYFRNEFYSKCRDMGFNAEQAGFAPENVKQVSCNYLTGLAGMLAVTVEYMAKETGRYLKRKDELGRMATEQLKMQAELRLKEARTGYRKYPIELEKELIAYVQLGDKVRARAIINNFLGEIFAYACGDLDIIKAKLFEFTAFLSRAAVEAGAPLNTLADTIKKSVTLLAENVDYVSICTTAVEIMNDFLDTVYENRKRRAASEHLSKAVKIINERYYEELTLESLASKVFVSAYYLSHLFRDEMDITFTDYLNKVRVDRAKEFLSEGCGVAEAAEKTGFNDPAYFMKIFKRYVGITPAKYKKAVTGFSGGSF